MSHDDRRGRLAALHPGASATLELGCGPRRAVAESITVDALDADCVDVVGDALSALRSMPDASAARVVSSHFLEHVDDLGALMAECARVLEDGGRFEAAVPHFSNAYFYSDHTHRRPFGLYSFAYFARCELFERAVPRYGDALPFTVMSVELGFDSPFPLRRAARRAFGAAVNSGRWAKEFYEENLTALVSCYELRAVLRRDPRAG